MDIIKVHYDEELQGVYGDDCRYLFDVSEKKLGEEVVKRINMHDELVKSLRDMVEMAGMAHYNAGWSERYLTAEKLLERCMHDELVPAVDELIPLFANDVRNEEDMR